MITVNYIKYRMKKRLQTYITESVDHPTLIIVLDSCRYDAFADAYNGEFPGELKRAYSISPWTLPSHEAIVRGSLPTPKHSSTHDLLENDYPRTYRPLPREHANSWGVAAMPYLHRRPDVDSPIPKYFDRWTELRDTQDTESVTADAKAQIEQSSGNWFGMVNYGTTHFPYANNYGKDVDSLIREIESGEVDTETVYEWQVSAAAEVIDSIADLRSSIPKQTNVVVTADHGELFGEDGSFGHNYGRDASFHEKVHEVPMITWVEDQYEPRDQLDALYGGGHQ